MDDLEIKVHKKLGCNYKYKKTKAIPTHFHFKETKQKIGKMDELGTMNELENTDNCFVYSIRSTAKKEKSIKKRELELTKSNQNNMRKTHMCSLRGT